MRLSVSDEGVVHGARDIRHGFEFVIPLPAPAPAPDGNQKAEEETDAIGKRPHRAAGTKAIRSDALQKIQTQKAGDSGGTARSSQQCLLGYILEGGGAQKWAQFQDSFRKRAIQRA